MGPWPLVVEQRANFYLLVQYLGFLYNKIPFWLEDTLSIYDIYSESMNEPCNSLSMMMTLAPLFAAYDPIHGEDCSKSPWPFQQKSIQFYYSTLKRQKSWHAQAKWSIIYHVTGSSGNVKIWSPLTTKHRIRSDCFFPTKRHVKRTEHVIPSSLPLPFATYNPTYNELNKCRSCIQIEKTAPRGCFPFEGINLFGLSKKNDFFS